MAQDAYLKVILKKGFEAIAVTHLGRYIPARVRTAVELRDRHCVVPGCGTNKGLEKDHVVPVREDGPPSAENLVRMCCFHHGLKTHRGHVLVGTHGEWKLVPGIVQTERAPPEGALC